MEDGSVATKADQKIRIGQFGLQILDLDAGVYIGQDRLIHREGKTIFCLHPSRTEQSLGAFGGFQSLISKGIGAKNDFHWAFPSKVSWEASTRAARSPV